MTLGEDWASLGADSEVIGEDWEAQGARSVTDLPILWRSKLEVERPELKEKPKEKIERQNQMIEGLLEMIEGLLEMIESLTDPTLSTFQNNFCALIFKILFDN